MTLPRLRSLSLSLVVAVLIPSSAAARATKFAALERVARAELKATHTPGAAIAVIADGKLVYTRGFGVASVETRAPVTPATLFRLGSTTKMLTGAALVTLAEAGKLDLHAPIGVHANCLAPALARLTAHQLLSNSAGVADVAAPFISHDDEALGKMVCAWQDDALFGEPGKVYSYASPDFWLAGCVLEQAGGKPYADMMDQQLFTPAGMTHTTLRPLVALTHPLVSNRSGETLPKTTAAAKTWSSARPTRPRRSKRRARSRPAIFAASSGLFIMGRSRGRSWSGRENYICAPTAPRSR